MFHERRACPFAARAVPHELLDSGALSEADLAEIRTLLRKKES
jgi:hypothetical protein